MERLELKDSLINLYEDDELTYSFNWERLSDIWDYATLDDVEGIGEVRAKNIKQGIKRMHEQVIYDSKFYR